MSHNVETMAYVGEVPWHGLGVKVEPGLSGLDFLKAAGLDWEVELRPLHFRGAGFGTEFEVPDHFAVVREGVTPLGVVGSKFTPIQNRELFAIPGHLVREGAISWETAGALQDGRLVWSLAKLPGFSITRKGGLRDAMEAYLLWTQRHDGQGGAIGGLTHVRVVCNNTLDAATGYKGQRLQNRVSIRHTASGPALIAEASRIFGEVVTADQQSQAMFQELADQDFSLDRMRAFAAEFLNETRGVEEVATDKRLANVEELVQFFAEGKGNTGESKWDAFNSVTEWLDHKRSVVKRTKDARAAAERRMQSTLLGAGYKDKGRALRLLTRY